MDSVHVSVQLKSFSGRDNVGISNKSFRLFFRATLFSGIIEARIVKFLTQLGYIKCYQKDDISPHKWAWLWSSSSSCKLGKAPLTGAQRCHTYIN